MHLVYISSWKCWYKFSGWMGQYMIALNGNFYGLAFLYLFFLLRLKIIFRNTALRLNKFMFIILLFGLLIQLITPIFSTYFFMSGWNPYDRIWALRFFNVICLYKFNLFRYCINIIF